MLRAAFAFAIAVVHVAGAKPHSGAGHVAGHFENLTVGSESVRVYVTGDARAPGVIVFHPWWGLNDDVLAFADRLAAKGFWVEAPDLVRGRIATTIQEAESIVSQADQPHADSVALGAIDRLAASGKTKIGTVGFSFGAAWALWSAAKRPTVAATVVYYGTLEGPSLAKASAPVLGHFAEKDPYESDEGVHAFEKSLHDAGRSVVVHRYEGTGHWFAEPSRDAWRPKAADLAFERTTSFLHEHLKGGK